MKRFVVVCVTVGLIFAASPPRANAGLSYGTPSPSLNPVFGTLINFDDQPAGTPVLANDYVAFGLASVTELTGAGAAFARYPGTQSPTNYIGTGLNYSWNGTIRFDLALPASQIGLGVADSVGGPETLSVYNSGGTLLESYILTPGLNIYAVITRPLYDISRVEISGNWFAVDDLQFNTIPAPGAILLGSIGVGLVSWLRRRRTL